MKLQSHETFLQKCLDREIIPNSLTSNSSYAIAKPHENLTYKLELLNNSNSFNSMKVIISHYQNEIFRLREEIQLTQQDLRTIATTSQYDFLLKTLQSFVRKTTNKYNFIKTKKLNRLIKNQSHTSARKSGQSTQTLWIPEFSLTSDDRQAFLMVTTSLIVLLMLLWHSCTNNIHFLCSSRYALIISFYIIIHGNLFTFITMVEIILLPQPLLVVMSKFLTV